MAAGFEKCLFCNRSKIEKIEFFFLQKLNLQQAILLTIGPEMQGNWFGCKNVFFISNNQIILKEISAPDITGIAYNDLSTESG